MRACAATADQLDGVATAVFGPLKKQAPKLPTGDGDKKPAAPLDDLEAKVLAGLSKVK